jgi:DNA polymerase I
MAIKNGLVKLLTTAEQIYKPDFQLILITTKKELLDLCTVIKESQLIAINLQGTDLDPMKSSCAGISIACDTQKVYFIPRHNNEDTDSLELGDVIACLQPIFADTNIEKVMLHATFHQIVAQQLAMPIVGKIFDIGIAAQLIDHPSQHHSSELLQNFYAKTANQSYEASKDQTDTINTIEHCLLEGIASTHQNLFLKNMLQTELTKQNLLTHFYTIEMAVHALLVAMQIAGVLCNAAMLKKLGAQVSKDLESLMYEINSYADLPVDITIPSQIKKLLFDTLKLPGKKRIRVLENNSQVTEHDALQEFLEEIELEHPIVPLIMNYYKLLPFQQNFLTTLPEYINPATGKIHAFWQQLTNKNHAIVCTHPNLQNIPTDSFDYKITIRDAFITQDNYSLLAIDYDTEQSIKTVLIKLDQQITNHQIDAHLIIVTPSQIILEIKTADLKLFESSLLTAANKKDFLLNLHIGKNWQEVSKK